MLQQRALHDPRCCIQRPTVLKADDPFRRPAGVPAASLWRRSGRPWRRPANRIRRRASSGRRRSRRGCVATLAITSRTSLTRGPSNSAPGETPRWRKVEPRSTLRRRALAVTAAPAQREEARRQLGRPLSHPGSRRATGSTARQTWKRVLDSRRHRPSRPSGVPRDSERGPRARARSSDTARTTPPRNRRQRARTRSSRPRTWRCPRRQPKAEWPCTADSAGLRGRSGRRDCARCNSGSR